MAPMEDALLREALRAYGLKLRRWTRFRRTVRVETDGGLFALTAVPDAGRFERAMERLLGYALRQPFVLLPVPTPSGRPVTVVGDRAYALFPWVAADTARHALRAGEWRWLPAFLEALAAFHAAYRRPAPAAPVRAAADDLIARWTAERSALEAWAADAAGRAYPSPVDVLFVHAREALTLALDAAIEAARRFRAALEGETTDVVLLHTRPAPERIALTPRGIVLLDWTGAEDGPAVRDLAVFFQSLAPELAARSEAAERLRAGLSAYRRRRLWQPEEAALLRAALFYPGTVLAFFRRHFSGEARDHLLDRTEAAQAALRAFYARSALAEALSVPLEERPDVDQK
ncbi:hypothetical protein AB1399_04170 [Hydrogenibacillus schlegelii]|uniref:Aminoglycoside phosphotransferase domain-containing protein n=1 Tax=Hydrogenibacillus schlegelii TaxID=1484 RepID=A0A179IRQ7_HYDSH|nr:hypothetical protein [Hydrogenibacillus schlegelii]MBT9282896.1 hypothetical protein [Hydrogenibacillus schlegelii]OAR04923.1 hypothetical protein SA87_04380 [Hydrogenibacillus schlegelii]